MFITLIGPLTVIKLAMLRDVIRNFLVVLRIEVIYGPYIILAINFTFSSSVVWFTVLH